MGSPTLELFVNSWNAKYPEEKIYIATTATAMGDGLNGYYIGFTENPTSDYIGCYAKEGVHNSLYFPHYEAIDNCNGYLLASPSAYYTLYVMRVVWAGHVNYHEYYNEHEAFRPVVTLPTYILVNIYR